MILHALLRILGLREPEPLSAQQWVMAKHIAFATAPLVRRLPRPKRWWLLWIA